MSIAVPKLFFGQSNASISFGGQRLRLLLKLTGIGATFEALSGCVSAVAAVRVEAAGGEADGGHEGAGGASDVVELKEDVLDVFV